MLDAVARPAAVLADAARWLAVAASLSLAAALVGLRLQADGIALFWPAAGVVAGLVLLARGASRWMAIAGALVGIAIANTLQDRSFATVAVFLAGNLVQVLLFTRMLENAAGRPFALDRLGKVLLFLAVAVATPALVAIATASGLRWSGHAQGTFPDVWWLWTSSNAVGLVSITPAVLLIGNLRVESLRGQAEDIALMVAVAAAAVVVIGAIVPEASLLMLLVLVLLVPLVCWVALRANMARAAIALLIISLVSIWTAAEGGLFVEAAWAGQAFLLVAGSLLLTLGAWRDPANTDRARTVSAAIDLRALVVLVPLAVFAIYTWWSWRSIETDAFQRVATRAAVIAKRAESVLDAQRLMLNVVTTRIRGRTGHEVSVDPEVSQFLSELTQTARMSRGVGIVDVNTARAVATSRHWPAPQPGFASFDWFMAHRDNNAPVQFGEVVRFTPSGPSGFTVSQYDLATRLIAVSLVGVELMEEAFALAREGSHDALTLIRADGVPMAMGRPDAKPVGFRAPPDSVFMRWRRGDLALPARERSGVDGKTRLWQIAQVDQYPVYVIYGLELTTITSLWLNRLVPFGLLSLAAAAALWLLTSRLQLTTAAASAARVLAENAEALRESEARFRSLASMSSDWYWEQDENFRFVEFSSSLTELVGWDRDWHIGKTRWEMPCVGVSEETWAEHRARLERHEPFRHFEYQRLDGRGQTIWICINGDPMFDAAGAFRGYRGTGTNITEQKRALEHIRLLMGEVNHRSKNILALVQAIARQTAATSPQDFLNKFNERLQSLAASQDLLVRSKWKAVPLANLIRSQMSHFADLIGNRIVLKGPPLSLTPGAAQTLGMAVHELTTNAAKYGALSNEEGRVTIAWETTLDDEKGPQFTLSWTERGGPLVRKPERSGFGSTVTSTMLRMTVGGEITVDYAPAGLSWRLTCAPRKIVEDDFIAPETNLSPTDHAGEHACAASWHVLVVEDEPLIADEIGTALSDAGFEVVGPAGSVRQAFGLLDNNRVDAAVLDVNLGNETSEAVARRLTNTDTPIVTVSGYTREQLPDAFRTAPLLGKPLHPDRLVAELRALEAKTGAARTRTQPA